MKAPLRRKMLEMRDSLSDQDLNSMSAVIMEKLFSRPRFREIHTIGFYIAKGSEVKTREMIEKAVKLGKEITVPVTNEKIEFCHFTSFDELVKGKYGILEPKKRIMPDHLPELIVVPGISFGLCMHRIGYGKGYYDQYLGNSFAYRIGICYDFQVVEKLPTHPNDQRMDEIITEKRIIT